MKKGKVESDLICIKVERDIYKYINTPTSLYKCIEKGLNAIYWMHNNDYLCDWESDGGLVVKGVSIYTYFNCLTLLHEKVYMNYLCDLKKLRPSKLKERIHLSQLIKFKRNRLTSCNTHEFTRRKVSF